MWDPCQPNQELALDQAVVVAAMCVQGRDSKQWIQEVKFSADGATFAVGSHDNIIYLYDARGGRYRHWGLLVTLHHPHLHHPYLHHPRCVCP